MAESYPMMSFATRLTMIVVLVDELWTRDVARIPMNSATSGPDRDPRSAWVASVPIILKAADMEPMATRKR